MIDNKLEQLLRLADQLNVKQINIEVESDVAVADNEELNEMIDVLKHHFKMMKEER